MQRDKIAAIAIGLRSNGAERQVVATVVGGARHFGADAQCIEESTQLLSTHQVAITFVEALRSSEAQFLRKVGGAVVAIMTTVAGVDVAF